MNITIGIPKIEKGQDKHLITVDEFISRQGNTYGNQLYSSTIVKKYLFWLDECNGPLKSMFSLTNGCVACINLP